MKCNFVLLNIHAASHLKSETSERKFVPNKNYVGMGVRPSESYVSFSSSKEVLQKRDGGRIVPLFGARNNRRKDSVQAA